MRTKTDLQNKNVLKKEKKNVLNVYKMPPNKKDVLDFTIKRI